MIWSDGWQAYFTLASHGFRWYWVNHTKTFKDPVTGVHTNRIEGKWKWLKAGIPHGARRRDVEEYVQLHNFKEWAKTHRDFKKLGVFGLLARASLQVKLTDKGRKGDKIPNMLEAIQIVQRNPLPLPPGPPKRPPTGRA